MRNCQERGGGEYVPEEPHAGGGGGEGEATGLGGGGGVFGGGGGGECAASGWGGGGGVLGGGGGGDGELVASRERRIGSETEESSLAATLQVGWEPAEISRTKIRTCAGKAKKGQT